jgi:hypothetical protein
VFKGNSMERLELVKDLSIYLLACRRGLRGTDGISRDFGTRAGGDPKLWPLLFGISSVWKADRFCKF